MTVTCFIDAEFLQELTKLPRDILVDLYEFIGIRSVFNREKLQLEGETREYVSARSEEGVLELLVRLDFDPTEDLTDL